MGLFDYTAKLKEILSPYLSENALNNAMVAQQRYDPLPNTTRSSGYNLTSQPDYYLPRSLRGNVQEKDLPFNVGGETSILGGVSINKDHSNRYDPATILVHEARHYIDNVKPLGDFYNKKYLGEEQYNKKHDDDIAVYEQIKNGLLSHYMSGNGARREIGTITGQDEYGEIVAQLRSYEAMLPAGMSIFQSPLGKKLLDTNEKKLWYLRRVQPSMSDQTYLEKVSDPNYKDPFGDTTR